jgi:hypothetical protein
MADRLGFYFEDWSVWPNIVNKIPEGIHDAEGFEYNGRQNGEKMLGFVAL